MEFLGLRGVWVPLSLSAFEKIKCIIFYCVDGKFGGRTTRRHRTLAFCVRCTIGCSRVHWTHRGESTAQRPVCGRFANLSGYESGEHEKLTHIHFGGELLLV